MSGFLYTPKLNTIVFKAHRTQQDHVLSHTGNHSSCEASAGSPKTLGLGYKVRPCLKNKNQTQIQFLNVIKMPSLHPLAASSLGLGMQFNGRVLTSIHEVLRSTLELKTRNTFGRL